MIGRGLLTLARVARAVRRRLNGIALRSAVDALGARSTIEPPTTIVNPERIRIGADVVIREHAWLNASDSAGAGGCSLVIGDRSYVGRFCQINAWRDVRIDDDVLIGDRVLITDADHNFGDAVLPIRHQGDEFRGAVHLRRGCWVGIGAVILPGVVVGEGAIVAANAVVTRDVAPRTVVGGVPARQLRAL